MSKNRLTDLNDHLFAQMERLQNEELTGTELKQEIDRAKATAAIGKEMISNAALVLAAEQYVNKDNFRKDPKLPAVFSTGDIIPRLASA
jgi:hypothetical protein